MNLLSLSYNNRHNTDYFCGGISFGREYRKQLGEKLTGRLGVDLFCNYSLYDYAAADSPANTLDYRQTISPGLNFVMGLNYAINDQFLIGVEMLPKVMYENETMKYQDSSGDIVNDNVFFSLSNTDVLLSVVFVW